MSISINNKTDYSTLFQNLSTSRTSSSGSTTNLNLLSDYALIKNGSYGKLMKAYYGTNSSSVSSLVSNSSTEDSTKSLATMQSATDELKNTADSLLATGKNAVISKDKITEEAYDTTAKFVSAYNSVISATDDINNTTILGKAINMVSSTDSNKSSLSKIGITINSDNTLSIDKDTFMNADAASVSSLLTGSGSYVYRVSSQASLINFATDNAIAKASIYTSDGSYSSSTSAGSIYNSYF